MGNSEPHFLTTEPGTLFSIEGKWCARHKVPRGFRWLHRLAHKTRILRNMNPKHQPKHIITKG